MSIMKETRWLPKKCPLQKNNEISATEMITTELYTSSMSADETPEMTTTEMYTAEISVT